ncbi:TPA: hypothetical protein N2C03_006730 [Pseudomonas aeruginosa]|nr:hypothetical protein [Pseudomonas aeruginosa]
MNTRRTAIWLGSLFGGLLYLFILAAGPIWGGIITAESTAKAQLHTFNPIPREGSATCKPL